MSNEIPCFMFRMSGHDRVVSMEIDQASLAEVVLDFGRFLKACGFDQVQDLAVIYGNLNGQENT